MEENIKDSGKRMEWKVMVNLFGLMVICIKEIILKIKSKEMENLSGKKFFVWVLFPNKNLGLMEEDFSEFGEMEEEMAEEQCTILMEQRKLQNGKMITSWELLKIESDKQEKFNWMIFFLSESGLTVSTNVLLIYFYANLCAYLFRF